ncbi:hypothetical protein IWQ60_001038 [Tieghemiomyces parasiticus]|uniref:Uncharacterized protein n=1 Tax=Tieghemiomyces parasiticus TaxID=78921 RepID=A0A9W8AEZ0_9FUNG|nr:hypothetical protein IWQ60_001038 [Tieghemiomyces parasiticus]
MNPLGTASASPKHGSSRTSEPETTPARPALIGRRLSTGRVGITARVRNHVQSPAVGIVAPHNDARMSCEGDGDIPSAHTYRVHSEYCECEGSGVGCHCRATCDCDI